MSQPLSIVVAGWPMQAWGERALFWPEVGMLVIADLHLGKGDVFRRGGIPLPGGGTAGDLQRLGQLVEATAARRLMILGDVLHGALNREAPWLSTWDSWRARHATLSVEAVLGNHDRALDAERLGLHVHGGEHRQADLVFRHEPVASAEGHVLAGHVHPVRRVRAVGLSARLPVFWLSSDCSVLPAFSAFTGGFEVRPRPGDRLLACTGKTVIALPVAGRSNS